MSKLKYANAFDGKREKIDEIVCKYCCLFATWNEVSPDARVKLCDSSFVQCFRGWFLLGMNTILHFSKVK